MFWEIEKYQKATMRNSQVIREEKLVGRWTRYTGTMGSLDETLARET